MVDVVEGVEVEEEISYEDAFDAQWSDTPEEQKPVIEEDNVPDPEVDPVTPEVEEPELTDEGEPHVERPVVAARDPYDWINGLPPEQQEMANRLKHEALSDRGRVSALTRKLSETTTELAKAHSPATPATEEASVPSAPQQSEGFRQLQEDYPELGKQLASVWEEREAALKQEFSAQLTPIKEAQTADAIASEQARLESEAAVIFNTPETGTHWQEVVKSEDFTAWLNMQPAFIQTTARNSDNAQDGIDVLRMYETDYQTALAAQNAAADSEAVENATSRGDKLKKQRQQRKATTVSPGSRPAGTDVDDIAGDYDSLFDAMWGGKK